MRTIVFWGLYWGSLILGNYHIHTVHRSGFRVGVKGHERGVFKIRMKP